MADQIHIEIVYAQQQQAIVKALSMAPGSRLGDALAAAAGAAEFSGVDLANAAAGIFGSPNRPSASEYTSDPTTTLRPCWDLAA